jgi:uncharacterized delta-60 repeat protein
VRYNTNGSLDSTFNGTGKVTTPIGATYDAAFALAVQADGKLVAAGYSQNGTNDDFAVVRYNTNGSLDSTFNGTGKVTTPIGTSTDVARALAVQPDGKLVAAGYSHNGSNDDFAVVRYNTDGTLDTTFNGTGKVTTPIGSFGGDARALAVQADGKLVAAGGSYNGSNFDFAVVRYNTNGSLDTTFNGTGKVTTPIGAANDVAYALVVQADGKLVAVGYSVNGTTDDFAVVRYTTDGQVDTIYPPGVVTNSDLFATGLAQQSDGKLLVSGGGAVDNEAKVARYLEDGTLDTSFGSGGIVSIDFSSPTQYFEDVLQQQPDGKVVAAGKLDDDFLITRFFSNGLLDGTFGTGGSATTDFGGDEGAQFILQQGDGKLVAVGTTFIAGDWDFALARYTASGALDLSFNGSGKVVTDFGGTQFDIAESAVLQSDGKILVGGRTGTFTDSDIIVARYNTDGSLDSSFGTGGKVAFTVLVSQDNIDLVLDPDGRILVSATGYDGASVPYAVLARLNADGSLDSSFGSGGVAVGPYGFFRYLVRESTGRLIVAGDTEETATSVFKLARFDRNGALDPTFGSGGVFLLSFEGELYGDLILQSDGKVVTAGDDYTAGAAVVRLQSSFCHSPDPAGPCAAPEKGQLLVKRNADPAKDKLIFKWLKGTADLDDFEDPTTSSDYSLCVYDDDGQALKMTVPAAATCGAAPCWSSSSTGYQYKDQVQPPTNAGVSKIKMKTGAGKAKINVKGRGDSLPDGNGQPLSGDVTALLVNEETGVCFATSFTGAEITQNDSNGFKAKTQ